MLESLLTGWSLCVYLGSKFKIEDEWNTVHIHNFYILTEIQDDIGDQPSVIEWAAHG